ncbi:MAG: fibronectin type III domain-containing protein [Candidatus Eisenbacteria bacterium]|nr:fibronectin type III domain-containing protein [Candidatus Eisenbacteria bacterium]
MRSSARCLAFKMSYVTLMVAALAVLFAAGCMDEDNDVYVDRTPPRAPQGVFTVTGDGQVDIYWLANRESDLGGYRIYWNDEAAGYYEYVTTTSGTHFTDTDVTNGNTYYYAVSAFDRDGNESDLSYETVSDTPRPEGFDLALYDFSGPNAALSGYVFSDETRQLYSLAATPATDIYYGYVGEECVMFTWNPDPEWPLTDIQDGGYRPLAELDDAPPGGWAESGWVVLTEGHSYFVWTRDNHYAKFYVKSVRPEYVIMDWAYQVDAGNPELAKEKLARRSGDLEPGTPIEPVE